MLIYWNAEGVHVQRKVGNPCSGSGMHCQYGVPKWFEIVKKLGNPELTVQAQGQMKWAKAAQKYYTYDITHKKNGPQKPQKLFSLQTQRIAESFEGLNSTLAHSATELCLCKATC